MAVLLRELKIDSKNIKRRTMKKKLLTIILMLLAGLTANAQGTWSEMEIPGDELKGIKGGTHYKYSVEGLGELEIYDWNDCTIRVGTYEGSFDYEEITSRKVMSYSMGGGVSTKQVPYATPRYSTTVLIGKYDNNGKLKDKIEEGWEIDHNQNCQNVMVNKKWFFYPQTCRKIKKMVKAMQSGDGYVRIVVKRKEMPDFDLKITPYNQ